MLFPSEWDCVSFQISSNRLVCANHGPASQYKDIVELDTTEIWKYDQTKNNYLTCTKHSKENYGTNVSF